MTSAAGQLLTGAPDDFDAVLRLVGDARFVLLGEASHGTHEFYRIRAEITKRLIREKGFTSVAVEADWPDAYRVNRYVQGRSVDDDAEEALEGFRRFPQWMWRNADVLDFVGWLRGHNDMLPPERRAGFYGLDLYALHSSIEAVLAYLHIVDPAAADRARARYACFDHFGANPQDYGYATSLGLGPSCEAAVVAELTDLRRAAGEYAQRDGRVQPDDYFYAEQNARLVRNAERYYRAMFGDRAESWNLRDRHMAETLDALVRFNGSRWNRREKVVVWAHNSHLGDARATEMSLRGELNVGQLVRTRYGLDAVGIGFLTYGGTVTAASDWDEPAQRMRVRPALPGSYEALFREWGRENRFVNLTGADPAIRRLSEPHLERAIGVIYRPESERHSHYFHARLTQQFDGVLYYDTTRAVEPLERSGLWERGEVAETFPSAL
ncbi:MAG TPA: erythromycin esterase family protein [Gemmatimonadales bacterium]|jgi:erythromycin esterase-like protein